MALWTSAQAMLGKHKIPDDYLSFDCETTGLRRYEDVILDFGYTLVREQKPVARGNMVLNWFARPDLVDPHWLRQSMAEVAYSYSHRGLDYQFSKRYLQKHGVDPIEALEMIWELLDINRKAGAVFSGHNANYFDCELVSYSFSQFLDRVWQWEGNEVFDSGCLEKALRALEMGIVFSPREAESLRDYFMRVRNRPIKGVKWNIEECAKRYDLHTKHGFELQELHMGNLDSFVSHLLIELYRTEVYSVANKNVSGHRPGQFEKRASRVQAQFQARR